MAISIWILFVIVYIIVKVSKVAGNNKVRGTGRPQAARKRPAAKPQQRSFAAMPQQKKAVPNVERNCMADDKHRYENNLSRFNKKEASAIPNVPNTRMHSQPKKSGNRRTARQLYIGDVVPRGMHVVRCGYCAADNLVPNGAGNEYKCYFCHYDI